MSEENLITVPEAAKIRQVSDVAIYALIKRGRLRSIEKYGVILVYRDEVEAFERGKPGPEQQKKGDK